MTTIYSREARAGSRHNREVLEHKPLKVRRRKQRVDSATIRHARYYQVEAVTAFDPSFATPGRLNGFLIMPTASGKSLVMIAMATRWLALGRKVIIVVPQKSIMTVFAACDFMVGDELIHWDRPCNLAEDQETVPDVTEGEVLGLLDFLEYPAEFEHAWICTYQTLIATYGPETRHMFQRAFLILDEAHHLSSDGADRYHHNRSGAILRDFLRAEIPHMLCTATPFRADGNHIVPRNAMDRYLVYVRQRADHVAELVHVDSYHTEINVGNVMEQLEARLRDVKARGRKALVALPQVGSHHARRFARQLGHAPKQKDNKLHFERAIIGLCQRLGLSIMSVVSEDDHRAHDPVLRTAFLRIAKEGSGPVDFDAIPDVTLVQQRYKEGTDCVAWSVCIQIGLSESCVALAQFPGRVLRDHWSKDSLSVEFHTILPDYDTLSGEDKFEWSLDIVKSLLILSFMDLDLLSQLPVRLPTNLHEGAVAAVAGGMRASKAHQVDNTDCVLAVTPHDVTQAWDSYTSGRVTEAQLELLNHVIPEPPQQPGQLKPLSNESLAALPKIQIDTSAVSNETILYRAVTEKVIQLGARINTTDARSFRNKLARCSRLNSLIEAEALCADGYSPDEIALMLELPDAAVIRNHLVSRGLLNHHHYKRPKRAVRRPRIPGTTFKAQAK